MMTKDEIIQTTLLAMNHDQGLLANGETHDGGANEYETIVIATLGERLADCDFKTCADYQHLNVECCKTCHTLYAHYDMHLENLADGGTAWICCNVRFALLEPRRQASGESHQKDVDSPSALSGELPFEIRVSLLAMH